MEKALIQRIVESRRLLGNPYAYLDDLGTYSASEVTFPIAAASPEEISTDRLRLQNQYAHHDGLGSFIASRPIRSTTPSTARRTLSGRYASLRSRRKNGRFLFADIESKAIEFQRLIWQDRDEIWPEGAPSNPIDMLDPGVAFQLLGFGFDIADGLGQYFTEGRQVEVAGLIDDSKMEARTSRRFPFEIQNFTAAHELGHAVLHDARGLHRDRPLDGSSLVKDPVETEANKFAAYFLMPAKLVMQHFEQRFVTNCFSLDENTRFALSRGGVDLSNCKTQRDLARILAGATNYNGVRFQSLAAQFRVSEEAMAIRLEELGAVAA